MKQNTLWKQLKIEDSGLSIKEVSEALQNKAKKEDFLGCYQVHQVPGNMLADKGITRAGYDSKYLQFKKGK